MPVLPAKALPTHVRSTRRPPYMSYLRKQVSRRVRMKSNIMCMCSWSGFLLSQEWQSPKIEDGDIKP